MEIEEESSVAHSVNVTSKIYVFDKLFYLETLSMDIKDGSSVIFEEDKSEPTTTDTGKYPFYPRVRLGDKIELYGVHFTLTQANISAMEGRRSEIYFVETSRFENEKDVNKDLVCTEDTVRKVHVAITDCTGLPGQRVDSVIDEIMNRGILFRERAKK